MFLALIGAYLTGNIYILIRALQNLSGLSLGAKIIFSICYGLIAFSLVISLFFRHAIIPEFLSKSLFTIGSIWLVFTLYMVLFLVAGDLVRLFFPIGKKVFLIALSCTVCLLAYGYYNYKQKCIPVGEDKRDYRPEVKDGIGITKVGVSLAYRFSLRRYKER